MSGSVRKAYARFEELSKEITHLTSVSYLLDWDLAVMMRKSGSEGRGKLAGYIAGLSHQKETSKEYEELLRRLHAEPASETLSPTERVNVRCALNDLEREQKIPQQLVEAIAEATPVTYAVWEESKKRSDRKAYLPHLKTMVGLCRERARCWDQASPYSACIQGFDPDMDVGSTEALLMPLRDKLVPLIQRIAGSRHAPDPKVAKLVLPIGKQKRLNKKIASLLGYTRDFGRLDASAHPFSTKIHPGDSRITTHYKRDDVIDGIYGTVHEIGHALYEGNLPDAFFHVAAGCSASYGLHEGNSRLWEKIIGHRRSFIEFLYPYLLEHGVTPAHGSEPPHPEELYRSMNHVAPSFIRIEADEVTYILHIVLRFEIERDLIEGRLEVEDLPDAWNAKTRDLLGLEVTDDATGFMQDMHWTDGSFGYFPDYALGNVCSAQLFAAMQAAMPNIDDLIRLGEFAPLRGWLKAKVWDLGHTLEAREIMRHATGSFPDAAHLIAHYESKYSEIYHL